MKRGVKLVCGVAYVKYDMWLKPADVATITLDNVAEWLRRQIANLLLFERAGSSPAVVDILLRVRHSLLPFIWCRCTCTDWIEH